MGENFDMNLTEISVLTLYDSLVLQSTNLVRDKDENIEYQVERLIFELCSLKASFKLCR